MLNDRRLKTLFPVLFPGAQLPADIDGERSPIQPASLDLSVGEVYLPGVDARKLGGVGSPQTEPYCLKPGHTAVVATLEELTVPSTHGAIGFPPTGLSNNGILMTNPGHLDPGYTGKLTFTVINMGREPFELRRADRIVTILFFKLDGGKPDKDYSERHLSSGPPRQPVTQDRMNRLAPDMLDVDRRVRDITDSAEQQTRRISIVAPLLLAIVVAAGTICAPVLSGLLSENADLKRRISILEDRKDQDQLQKRLDQLEQEIGKVPAPPTPGASGGTR